MTAIRLKMEFAPLSPACFATAGIAYSYCIPLNILVRRSCIQTANSPVQVRVIDSSSSYFHWNEPMIKIFMPKLVYTEHFMMFGRSGREFHRFENFVFIKLIFVWNFHCSGNSIQMYIIIVKIKFYKHRYITRALNFQTSWKFRCRQISAVKISILSPFLARMYR